MTNARKDKKDGQTSLKQYALSLFSNLGGKTVKIYIHCINIYQLKLFYNNVLFLTILETLIKRLNHF